MIATWQAPSIGANSGEELLLSFDEARDRRVLILPALFDEANKMRRFTVQLMRQLDAAGIDSFLPDLPGCNESLIPLNTQTLQAWRAAAADAAKQVSANEVLTVRAGVLNAPPTLKGWQYAPQTGPKLLRGMIRAKIIAEREDGGDVSSEQLMVTGRASGVDLNGWPIDADMFGELADGKPHGEHLTLIDQKSVGGAGLWLRAEPGEDDTQAAALAAIVAGTADQTS